MASLFPQVAFTNSIETPVEKAIHRTLLHNHLRGYISAQQAHELKTEFNLTDQELYFALLPFATCYAYPVISKFNVGAIIEDLDGNFYFGGNQEYEGLHMQYTIHAEQCAINHAYCSGARGIKSIIVNYSPCGHCRQFINEVNTAKELKIYLPQIPDGAPLSHYLPDSFGPADLDIKERLFDNNHNRSVFHNSCYDDVKEKVIRQGKTYSPYSNSEAFVVAATVDRDFFVGRYIENAAFNPSLPAILSAICLVRVYGLSGDKISRFYVRESKYTPLPITQLVQMVGDNFGINVVSEVIDDPERVGLSK
ncbi:cytidine deaminase [Psittacicella hinzii]|uniref:Cytidine deaminase n=1 Tax=Psittacicella hinzii TaxID=2028575 RepID=A0A3A1Y1E2_9GAMM|nr:cytidine deaminase [Psittacicella hinzii]RIY31395.1 cytidine deaminase [Psittacicella hinzii]